MTTKEILNLSNSEIWKLVNDPKKFREALNVLRKTSVSRLKAEDARYRQQAGMPTLTQENYEKTGSILERAPIDYNELNTYSAAAGKLKKAGGIKRSSELATPEQMKRQFDVMRQYLNAQTSTHAGYTLWRQNFQTSVTASLKNNLEGFPLDYTAFESLNDIQFSSITKMMNKYEELGHEPEIRYTELYYTAERYMEDYTAHVDEEKYKKLHFRYRTEVNNIPDERDKAIMVDILSKYQEMERQEVLGYEDSALREKIRNGSQNILF